MSAMWQNPSTVLLLYVVIGIVVARWMTRLFLRHGNPSDTEKCLSPHPLVQIMLCVIWPILVMLLAWSAIQDIYYWMFPIYEYCEDDADCATCSDRDDCEDCEDE